MSERLRNLEGTAHSGSFATTRWSIVLASANPELPQFRSAMQQLARTYHSASVAFIAAFRRTREDAEDLAQEFFLSWLEKGMPRIDPDAGSFRPYLKAALRHFAMNDTRARRVRKAIDGTVPLDDDVPGAAGGAEQAFDEAYRSHLIARAIDAMTEEYAAEGRPVYADAFRSYYVDLPDGRQPTYRELSERLGTKETDLTNWLAHARRRLRRHVILMVRDSVSDDTAFHREMEALFEERGSGDGLP